MSDAPAKLSIDIRSGNFIVEGREEFVREMWKLFEAKIGGAGDGKLSIPASPDNLSSGKQPTHSQMRVKGKGQKSSQKPVRLKDLDLSPMDEVGLHEFHKQAGPKTFYETNTVFVYYLSKLRDMTVTASHVYTCYEQLALKAPTAFIQSLRDTASDKKWIDSSDIDDIRTSIAGDNFVRELLAKEGDGD